MAKRRGSGSLRHYVTIQTFTETPNAGGQPIKTWSTRAANVPCDVRGVRGNESLRGQQVDATTTHIVMTRFRSDVTTSMRLIDHRTRTLEVVAVVDRDGRERMIDIHCKEST